VLGGRLVFTEASAGQWVAVIKVERAVDASFQPPTLNRHEMAGVGLDHQPDFARGR